MRPRLGVGLLLAPALLGCPANDTNGEDESGGETGPDTGVPIPADPFGGEGSDPPGVPDASLDWPQPLTLGNGLVHDSRYDLRAGKFSETFTAAQLVAGVDWAPFVDSHALKLKNGFRPTQVDADVTMKTNLDETIELTVLDRSVYVSDDDANYKTKIKTFVFGNTAQEAALNGGSGAGKGQPRPTSIDTFALPSGRVGATVALVYDNNPIAWELVVGKGLADFEATIAKFAGQGFRPISIASRRRNGASEYAGIFVKDGVKPDDWHVMLGLTALELVAPTALQWSSGFYPVVGTYEQGSKSWPRFNVLWMRRSPGLRLQLRFNMNKIGFEGEDQAWRKKGYHLEGACAYRDAGLPRYAGMWVRHEPHMRWRDGVHVDENDPVYLSRYLPFHQQAVTSMTRVGTEDEGEYFRPSATLHIFEGDELVFNRAYTYAAAIYPETPLNAAFALASASKSITAAAVVRELQVSGISLTDSFAQTAGIKNVPAMAQVMNVDVLRNLGGFNENVRSYLNHSLIDASPYGEYPIMDEEMYDYIVQGGHLDKHKGLTPDPAPDSYWNLSTYNRSQNPQNPEFIYSNPGYSVLGKILHVQSGKSYEDYVHTNFLVPLGLAGKIYPDRGHRNAADEPTQAGLRSYLINDSHPYSSVGCRADSDCSYLVCGITDPDPQDCTTSVCGPNNTCIGCAADAKTCRPGWSCVADECINTTTPLMQSGPAPEPEGGDSSPRWSVNTGPIDPTAPTTSADFRYAGMSYMGGAPLASGGWHGDGESLGVLIRTIAQTEFLLPKSTAAQLWSPTWWNPNQDRASNWFYGLGWYVRGNWIAMAGGTDGAMSLILHNRAYDFTVVFLSNVRGNALDEFLNPLLTGLGWSPVGAPCPGNCSPSPMPKSVLGGPFPCIDDLSTLTNECQGFVGAY
jgi:CubicO group peptidase (beta-lactamase class C family)